MCFFFCNVGAFSDFGEFMSRDPFFSSMQSNQSPRNNVNNQSNNSFPPIGTFTIESTSPQSNQIFSQPDFFNNSSQSNNSMLNGSNGGNNSSGINGSNSTGSYSNSNNNSSNSGGDPNQATRETGIIEKLLVCSIHFHLPIQTKLIFFLICLNS